MLKSMVLWELLGGDWKTQKRWWCGGDEKMVLNRGGRGKITEGGGRNKDIVSVWCKTEREIERGAIIVEWWHGESDQ